MELVQADTEAPTLYRGPGYIRQDDQGRIAFRIFPIEVLRHPSPAEFAAVGTAGKLLTGDQYYRLAATDARGRRWVAEKVFPDAEHGVSGLISVSGTVHALTTVETVDYSTYSQTLYFFDALEVPYPSLYRMYMNAVGGVELVCATKDVEKLLSADFAVAIQGGDGAFTIDLTAARPFPWNLETRVVESLQFVLARSLWCRAVTSTIGNEQTIRLTSPRPASTVTRLQPPIPLWSLPGLQHFWQLFDLYLRYALRRSEPGWNPCTVYLHAACQASANSIEAYALGLAVAVEGIADVLYPECATLDEPYKALVKSTFEYIDSLFSSDKLCWKSNLQKSGTGLHQRIMGFRGQVLQVRAPDRMYQLARDGVLDEGHIRAWKRLRNTSAHAGMPGTPISQGLIDDIMSVTMLMYHLVFNAVGFTGRYVDYATHGYPPRSYPSREIAPDRP